MSVEQGNIDEEIEALGGDLSFLNIGDLASQLAKLPPQAQKALFDEATAKQLSKIASSNSPKPLSNSKETEKGGSKSKAKIERPLEMLGFAAQTEEEDKDETQLQVEVDELERLSQLSEHNAQEIAELKLLFKRHEEALQRQAKDIAILLSQNTDLKRTVSSLTAASQEPIALSYGSRQGHFDPPKEDRAKLGGREVRASEIEMVAPKVEKAIDAPVSASKIKPRVEI